MKNLVTIICSLCVLSIGVTGCSKSEKPHLLVDPSSYDVIYGPLHTIESQCYSVTETDGQLVKGKQMAEAVSFSSLQIAPSSYREWDADTCLSLYVSYAADGTVLTKAEYEHANGHRTRATIYSGEKIELSQHNIYEGDSLLDIQSEDIYGNTYQWEIADNYPIGCKIYNQEGELVCNQDMRYENKSLVYLAIEDLVNQEKNIANQEWNEWRQLMKIDRIYESEGESHSIVFSYAYDDRHLLVHAQIDYDSFQPFTEGEFEYLSFDAYGNWLTRKITITGGKRECYLEERTITYYE